MALDFNGTTDRLSLGSAVLSAAPLTMACWANLDNVTAAHGLISIQTTGHRFGLAARGDLGADPVRAECAAGAAAAASAAAGYTAGTWFHGAAVFTSPTSRLAYKDGVAGSLDATSRTPAGLAQTDVGSVGAASFADGRIAEAAIWNVALTAAEILALANGYSPRLIRPSALVFHPPLKRSGLINLRGAPLTVTGSPAASPHPRILYPRGVRIGVTDEAVPLAIAVPSGNLALSTFAPTLAQTANRAVEIPGANLLLSAFALGVAIGSARAIEVPAAGLTLSTSAPSVAQTTNASLAPPSGDLTLSSSTPVVQTTAAVAVSVPSADLLLSTVAPSITQTAGRDISIPSAALALSTSAPDLGLVINVHNIEPPSANLVLSSSLPTVALLRRKATGTGGRGMQGCTVRSNVQHPKVLIGR